MSEEMPFSTVIVTVRDNMSGAQTFYPYVTMELDAEKAAAEAFEAHGKHGATVLDLQVFAGPPRRFSPRWSVTERGSAPEFVERS